jgi:hypothetical protein
MERCRSNQLLGLRCECDQESAGIDVRKSQKTAISRIENTMPAIAAAFGVFRFACVSEPDFIAPLSSCRGPIALRR